jgi:hypothetical protein
VFRFDYWLEMIVKQAEFVQDHFPGEISDYLADCLHEELPKNTKIVAFPRDPKPHEVTGVYPWVLQNWK